MCPSTHAVSAESQDGEYDDFGRLVRDALNHLYDTMHLQTHPLSRRMPRPTIDKPSLAGQSLRRCLLDAIDSVRPPPGTPSTSKILQKYRILELRYVDDVDPTDIQEQLLMSRTEYYREHSQALAAVISVLREQWGIGNEAKESIVSNNVTTIGLAEREAQEIGAQLRLELLDVRDVVREVVAILAPLAQQREVTLQLRPNLPQCFTQADRVVLRQALLNIVRQLMDEFAPGILDLQTHNRPDIVGIHIEGKAADRRSPDSSTLDLTISTCLIECLHGQIAVGRNDHACTVEVTLPITRRRTLLVIDNQEDFVFLVSRYLRQENWKVIGSTNAEHGLRSMETSLPDLILLDVLMPGCDGWDILRRIRANPQTAKVPVIICSVLKEEPLAVSLGAAAYLVKPMSQMDLLRAVSRWPVGTGEAETMR